MHRSHLRALCLALLLTPVLASATQSRKFALNQNQLFEDDSDYYLLPAVAAHLGGGVVLHLGAGGTQGSFLHPQRWTWGFSYGTPVAYDDIAATDALVNRDLLEPSRLISFFMAKKTDEDSAFGFAINPSLRLSRNFPVAPAVITNTVAFELEAILGWSTRNERRISDTAVALAWHKVQSRSGGRTVSDTPVLPSVALRHRAIRLGEKWDWGYYAELARRDESYVQREPFTSQVHMSRWLAHVGFGPRFRPVEGVTLGPALELTYEQVGGAIDQARFGAGSLTFPALRVSAEVNPFRWLFIRAGLHRAFKYSSIRPATGGQTDSSSDPFDWSAGLGVAKGAVQVDATLSNALLLEGPAFIGGTSPGLFGSLTFRYHY